jgi:hypothetical protein
LPKPVLFHPTFSAISISSTSSPTLLSRFLVIWYKLNKR